jgi:hypothetical protein
MKRLIESTQRLGRALMLPIAVLPVAGLLLRLGQPDLLDIAPIAAAGDAIFSNASRASSPTSWRPRPPKCCLPCPSMRPSSSRR